MTFRVRAPETPDGNPLSLFIKPPVDYQMLERIEMSREGDFWVATAHLPENGLVQYVYDHYVEGEAFEGFKGKREAHGESTAIESRFLLVTLLAGLASRLLAARVTLRWRYGLLVLLWVGFYATYWSSMPG